MNYKVTLLLPLFFSSLHSQSEEFTKEYIEENAEIHIGSVSQQAVVAKHFIGLFNIYEEKNDGSSASSWKDFQDIGFDLDSFEQDMRVDFSKTYAFVKANSMGGKVPVLMNRAPADYRSDGSLGRYVIWFNENGSYYFSKIPEAEIDALFSKYKVELIDDVDSLNQSNVTKVPQSTPVVFETVPEPPTVELEVKEPTEVAPVEVAEEAPAESSRWWLWLVGLLVVAGGLVLVLRRKS